MEEIFRQAAADLFTTRLATKDSVSYIRKGIKMENKNQEIKIYNTKFGNDFYTELTEQEYELFLTKGWKIGCYMMALKNHRRSLERLSKKIITEVNQRKNHRHYNALKEGRSNIMERFTETLKLLQDETK
jgi:hypothetical protein